MIAIPASARRPAVVVKRYRVRGRSERLKYLVAPSRARREWRALRQLEELGFPTPRPLAYFEERRGPWLVGAGLVMERLVSVSPLPSLLFSPTEMGESKMLARERRLRAVGALVARLHRAGIAHPDLHLGNFLGAPDDPDDIRLVDLHAVHHVRAARAPRRRRDLAKLIHSLGTTADTATVGAIIGAYLEETGPGCLGDLSDEVDRVVAGARRTERTRLRSRDRRCWYTTSQFVRERRGRFRIHRRCTLPASALEALLEGGFTSRRVLSERPGRTVEEAELPTPGGTRTFIVTTHARGVLEGFCDRFRRGPLPRAWGAARSLEVRKLPHATAEALLIERRRGRVRRTLLVSEFLPGRTLDQEIVTRSVDPRDLARFLRRCADAIAPLLRRLHRAGIHHRDVSPSRWLVAEGPGGKLEVALLHLESIHRGERPGLHRRLQNLVQLAVLPDGLGDPRLRMRFLLRYHEGERVFPCWRRALDRAVAVAQVGMIEERAARELAAASQFRRTDRDTPESVATRTEGAT